MGHHPARSTWNYTQRRWKKRTRSRQGGARMGRRERQAQAPQAPGGSNRQRRSHGSDALDNKDQEEFATQQQKERMSERRRRKGAHRERGRMRPVVQHKFDSTLGYPGEGPEHIEVGAWVAVHVSVSREASDVEARWGRRGVR